jgi:hypothetical protein
MCLPCMSSGLPDMVYSFLFHRPCGVGVRHWTLLNLILSQICVDFSTQIGTFTCTKGRRIFWTVKYTPLPHGSRPTLGCRCLTIIPIITLPLGITESAPRVPHVRYVLCPCLDGQRSEASTQTISEGTRQTTVNKIICIWV